MRIFFLKAVQMSKASINPLARVVTDRTGIIDIKISFFTVRQLIARLLQNAGKLFGISRVHLTAKGGHTGRQLPAKPLFLLRHKNAAFFQEVILSGRLLKRRL